MSVVTGHRISALGISKSILMLIILSIWLLNFSSADRILITTPGHGSHMLDKLHLGQTLVSRGHEVYLAIADKYPKMSTITKMGVKPLTFEFPSGEVVTDSNEFLQLITDSIFSGQSPLEMSYWGSMLFHRDCAYMMEDKEFLEKVRALNFSLVITEPFVLSSCNLIIPAHFNIPFVSFCGYYIPLEIRMPAFPSFVSSMAPYTLENIKLRTIWSKLYELGWFTLAHTFTSLLPGSANTSLIEKFAPQYKSWAEILRQAELFINTVDHHLGSHFPAFPNFISAAGITAVPAKPLPADLEKVMIESGNHGVIVLSFGTSAYYMPDSITKIFFEAFAKVNQTVVARMNLPQGVTVPRNVKLLKWLPQTDVLGHKKTKLFITHCGNNGQYEALYHAVPMIGFPLFAEQHENSIRAQEKGISIGMNILDFTAEELVRNIEKVIYTDKYRDKIREMSARYHDDKSSPRDRAAFWIEHVIKYGGRHLRSPAMELSIYEFLMLDVFVVVLVAIVLLAVLFYFVGRAIYRKIMQTYFCDVKLKSN